MNTAVPRGTLVVDTLDGFRVRHGKYRHWEFDVVEGPDHTLWVHTGDLRLLWEEFPSDQELQTVHYRHLLHDKSGKAYYLRAHAMRAELQKCRDSARGGVLGFLEFFQRDFLDAAQEKRSQLPNAPAFAESTGAIEVRPRPDPGREDWGQWRKRRWHDLMQFVHGQHHFVLTLVVLLFVMPWSIYLLAEAMLPQSLDWALHHRRVAWGFAVLALVSHVAGLLYAYTLSRGAWRVWDSGRWRWLVLPTYLLTISGAWTLPAVFTNRDMVNYWWAGLRGKPHPVSVYADPHLGRLVLRGPFEMGSADALEAVLAANPDYRLIQLESPGGYVVEGLRMERIVREHQLDTVVMEACASACTLAYAGGTDRYLGPQALMGFHRSGFEHSIVDYGWNPMDYKMQKVWLDRGVDKKFTEQALKEPIYRVWVPQPYEMLRARYATAMWDQRKAGY